MSRHEEILLCKRHFTIQAEPKFHLCSEPGWNFISARMRKSLSHDIICVNEPLFSCFPQIWTSVQVKYRRVTSTLRVSTQWVLFHVPVMKDTLETARFAEVYKYWTTAAWYSIVIPLSMNGLHGQTCVSPSIKHCFESSSARHPALCFFFV